MGADSLTASSPPPVFDADRAVQMARQTLRIEAQALLDLEQQVAAPFADAVRAVLASRGRVIVMGMGKSGHVGRKIAATLASTGTPAFFVHPGEASHGDLGMVTPGDVVLAISNSGESEELAAILPALKRLGVTLLAMTGRPESALAAHADVLLSNRVAQEACPLNLAPTASTTAQLALGDALAVALLDARGFRAEDFARSHPGGALGRKLLTHVRDVMRSGEAVPMVREDTPFFDVMREMSAKGLGCTAVVDAAQRPLGIFTDGDLRRLIERGGSFQELTAGQIMHRQPRTVPPGALAVDAADLMERARIHSVLVADEAGTLVGALTYNDLLSAKVI
ncbi:MAG TPA: KpsF/GutQ family sugar-phosphate isomerase [Burkholderiaceae bacterium]|nr:KpsF/GutQ family sugar-phosphate isomerase [Burkholderiaceae bacterium]HMX12035.1 KpsF/GutQ family sugar-phosphate isomerase [Burkholderiaceae bacterium]HMZ00225.1 KpsF/GutQ family sugar-phosphate isomerase [Burkholderiaceae bacterium]HNB44823.1 KpsF/GutQ family sugar-phosphate isomerase [Burkholderiaceae bacterium]HNG80607.1 KpsF/GutQ family sugar-phosphate isomerase [Burkholderiaceae bacterium]